MSELIKLHNKKIIAAVGVGILAYCLKKSKKDKKPVSKDDLSPESIVSEGKKVSFLIKYF
jgi:hypothetical protein